MAGKNKSPEPPVSAVSDKTETPSSTVLPLQTSAEIVTETAAKSEQYPDNFKDALALLQKESAAPVSNEAEDKAKQKRLAPLRAHVGKIQQGLPVLPVSANDHASVHEHRRLGEKRAKLERLARSHMEVKELLAEVDSLTKQLSELKSKK